MTPGSRYFKCHNCNFEWRDKCRDCESPSGEQCYWCDDCFVEPFKFEKHPEWPIDKFGNLMEDSLEKSNESK